MRDTQAEKMEIIRLVEMSDLSIRQTLRELYVLKSSFYRWYHRYQEEGFDGLANRGQSAGRFWNKIPQLLRDEVIDLSFAIKRAKKPEVP